MDKRTKILRNVFVGAIILIFLILRGFQIGDSYVNSDSTNETWFQPYADGDVMHYYQVGNEQMRYAVVGPQDADPVLLIHGSPGNISNRRALFKKTDIASRYRVYIPDRPGFGYSGKPKYYSIQDQTTLLEPLLETAASQQPVHIIGYSLGGPYVTTLAARHPSKVASQIHVASAVDPDNEKIRLASYLVKYPPLRRLMPSMLMVTVDEKFHHPKELEEMMPLREKITGTVALMHGNSDRIVPVENSYFIQEQLTNASNIFEIIDDDQNHSLPFSDPQRIVDVLDEVAASLVIEGQ